MDLPFSDSYLSKINKITFLIMSCTDDKYIFHIIYMNFINYPQLIKWYNVYGYTIFSATMSEHACYLEKEKVYNTS